MQTSQSSLRTCVRACTSILSVLVAGCDALDPPAESELFGGCCAGAGSCVPSALVPAQLGARLAQKDCGAAQLCAPSRWLHDPQASAKSCATLGGREGRCLPSCLPEVGERAASLLRESCAAEELCVPCYDPVSGEDTQACRINTDHPRDAPRTFQACCGDQGRCLPARVLAMSVSPEDAQRLGDDSCTKGEACVPSAWLQDGEPVLSTCRTAAEREGRCLPSCLPEVAAQADRLAQETCADAERCVPCFDPLTGTSTGACELAGDKPQEPARPFGDCCGGSGRCIPPASLNNAVSAADTAQLGADVCTEEALCVPSPWLEPAGPQAQACTLAGDLEGRCLPRCLPAVAAQAEQLQQRACDTGQLCVPCFDPLDGQATGACTIAGDQPRGPVQTFASCCGTGDAAQGVCLPRELLRADQAESLPIDSCQQAQSRCVPRALTVAPNRFSSCTGALLASADSPSVCVPACLLSGLQGLLASTGSCAPTQRCVECAQLPASAQSGCP